MWANTEKLPKPDLYVVYTGIKNVPDVISLREELFDGDSPIDVHVKIFHNINGTLCWQYVGFCRVFDEQRKIYHNSIECAKATIRICMERGYLSEYLKSTEKETIKILEELYDEAYQRKVYEKC